MSQNLLSLPAFGSSFSAAPIGADFQSSSPSTPVVGSGMTFGEALQNAFDGVNTLQNQASDAASAFAAGKVSDIHDVMIAAQKASVSLDLATQIRDQVVNGYQQIMQTTM